MNATMRMCLNGLRVRQAEIFQSEELWCKDVHNAAKKMGKCKFGSCNG
jgi:hypothetical protein